MAVRVLILRHLWREAMLADRVAYGVIGLQIGITILLIAGCFPG